MSIELTLFVNVVVTTVHETIEYRSMEFVHAVDIVCERE
jgi:hypothetical protein